MCECICPIIVDIIKAVTIGGILAWGVTYFVNKKLEDYKTKEVKRQKAILIAELLSEWISRPEDRKKLNQLTFEAFIWLPKDIALKLSQCLSCAEDAPSTKELVADARKIILGNEEAIDANKIIHFPQKKNEEL